MKLGFPLFAAVCALDLYSCDDRYAATALAIALLENIMRAESMCPASLEVYRNGLDREYDANSESHDDIRALCGAISMLYSAYALRHYRGKGIRSYFRGLVDAASCGPLK